jgi:hypothetical protein
LEMSLNDAFIPINQSDTCNTDGQLVEPNGLHRLDAGNG